MNNKKNKIIKVAFIYDRPTSYMGGYNYLYNLIFSLGCYGFKRKNIIIFSPNNIHKNKLLELSKFGILIKCRFLTRLDINWFINRFCLKFFKFSPYIYFYRKKYKFTHTYFSTWNVRKSNKIKQIYWLPDLQYLKYPEYFSDHDIRYKEISIKNQLNNADTIVLSSNTIRKELLQSFKTKFNQKSLLKVLNFHSSIVHNNNPKKIKLQLSKFVKDYQLEKGFFFCPNQFWSHKNHLKLIEAFAILLKMGKASNLKLILTGSKYFENQNSFYFDNVMKLVDKLNINNQVIYLENLNFIQMQSLYCGCIALINPSFYEGWSTTIEESRAYKVKVIISDIKVNREQNCPGASYFDPNSINSISKELQNFVLQNKELIGIHPSKITKKRLNKDITKISKKRLEKFAQKFIQICQES